MLAMVLMALSAAPGLKLAATPFVTVDLPPARGELYSEHFAIKLVELDVEVTTPRDIATLLGLERQKQLLACDTGASCLAELAGALGVDELVTGEVARVGEGFQLSLKVLNARGAKVRFARSQHLDSEKELFATLELWARQVAGVPEAKVSRWWAMVPASLGVACAAVGAGFLVSANAQWNALGQRGGQALLYPDAVTAQQTGAQHQLVGLVLVGAGVVVAAAGFTWFALAAPAAPVKLSLVPTLNGVLLVGSWP